MESQIEYQKRQTKGTTRVEINNLLSAVSLGVLSILLVDKGRVSAWIIGQLSIAIPVLVTSSLAYEKYAYRDRMEQKAWDLLGRLTHSVGYMFILNSIILLLYSFGYEILALTTLAAVIALHGITLITKINVEKSSWRVAVRRFLFYLLLILLGSAGPILAGWVAPVR